jgi:uncharacterized SAM-dependent methyltransferase
MKSFKNYNNNRKNKMISFIKNVFTAIKSKISSAYNKILNWWHADEAPELEETRTFNDIPRDALMYSIAGYCDRVTLGALSRTSYTNARLLLDVYDKKVTEHLNKAQDVVEARDTERAKPFKAKYPDLAFHFFYPEMKKLYHTEMNPIWDAREEHRMYFYTINRR